MSVPELFRRLRDWTRRDQLTRELDEELAFHRQSLERDALAAGQAPEQARRYATRRLGNLGLAREDARQRWGVPSLEQLLRDLRHAVRGLRRAPAFTITVDWNGGPYRTGISATERRNTARALADPASRPGDFLRPGHLFPLVAREGGVLARPGHTEAAVDLCQLAGLVPVGVIGELLNDDGSVMRGPAVEAFAKQHGLLYATVADLIAYRSRAAA